MTDDDARPAAPPTAAPGPGPAQTVPPAPAPGRAGPPGAGPSGIPDRAVLERSVDALTVRRVFGEAYELGDFAVATALSLPYAQAARAQAGLSTEDGAATRSAVCMTVVYHAQWYNQAFADVVDAVISPGDLDEAVIFLLTYGVEDHVFPNVDASGFELVGQYRAGFLQGGGACNLN